MLMSMVAWADQTVTVSANSSDISEGLDLKVVAKLFAEAKNLEEFESMLNNPDSAFCNLDLNGDGEVDYLRVVETGEGNKRLIVLQAVLAKDIYQDVASIYVEKDEKNEVSVLVVGDEYVYGTNYIIEPVYVYRPVIFDWFWSSAWYAWHSPWYWGYWPGWWYSHRCWAHDWYWRHCYAFHHHHHYCSFRPGRHVHNGYHELHGGVTRRDFATAHPDRSFSQRNSGMTNARDIQRSTGGGVRTRQASTERSAVSGRTYGSQHTAATRSASATTRSASATTRSASATTRSTAGPRTASSTTRSAGTATATTRTASTSSTPRTSGSTRTASVTTRSAGSTSAPTRTASSVSSTSRSAGSYSSYSGASRSSSAYTGSSRSSSSSFSGGSRSSSSSFSGGSRSSGSSYSGGSSRSSGGGGGSHRR